MPSAFVFHSPMFVLQKQGNTAMAEVVVMVSSAPSTSQRPGSEADRASGAREDFFSGLEPELVPATTEPEPADRLLAALKSLRWPLGTLATVAVLAVLYFARDVCIPVALAIVLSLLLRPAVRWMHRRRIPEPVGALACLICLVIAVAAGVVPLLGPAQQWINDLPQHTEHLGKKFTSLKHRFNMVFKIRSQIAEFAKDDEAKSPVPVTVQEPELATNAGLITSTGHTLGTWVVVIVMSFFLLTAGDPLINNVLMILPTFREKRKTVEMIKEIERGISNYLVTITIINIGLGFAITLALWLMGVPNAPVWGLMTTIFNYVPFLGQGVAGIIITLVAVLSFDSVGYALLVPVVFYSIAAIEGNVITPALLGHRMSLNPILVLLFLLGWGWMWGVAGAFLAVPILASIKLGCDRFECTRPVGTVLGG